MRYQRFFKLAVLFSICCWAIFPSSVEAAKSPYTVELLPPTSPVPAGSVGTVKVTFFIPDGHKLYREQLGFALMSSDGLTLTGAVLPGLESETELKGVQIAFITISVPTGAGAGNILTGTLNVSLQGCTELTCFPPEKRVFQFEMTVGAAQAKTEPAPLDDDLTGQSFLRKLKGSSWLMMMGIVYLAGLVLSLTPCVYPMLIITLTIVGAHGENKSPVQGFILSGVYVLGIAITFSVLGVAAAAAGSLFGAWMQNIWAMGTLAVIFFILALGMFDVYQFSAPQNLSSNLSKLSGKGLIGIFLMGLISGLVLSPCTGPVLVGLLAYIAETGRLLYGFTLLFAMAIGMGTLMLLVGTFAGVAQKLPRAGTWMIMVRNIFGVLLIGMSLYYAKLALPGFAWLVLLGLCLSGLGVALRTLLDKDQPRNFSYILVATLGLALIVSGLTIIVACTFDAVLDGSFEKTGLAEASAGEKSGGLRWETDISAARRSGKPVVVDVAADWCPSCHQLDRETFSDPSVAAKLASVTTVRVDITRYDDQAKATLDELWQLFNISGPHTAPKIFFFDRQGKPLPALTVSGFVPPDKFLAILDKLDN